MSEPFIGEIILFGGNFAPRGWAFCHGQLLPIAQNTALFSLLGTAYGGNGRTDFGLPDLRGRAIVGVGQGPGLTRYRQGERFGAETVALNSAQIPGHNHGNVTAASASLTATSAAADQHEPSPTRVLAQASLQGNAHPDVYSDGAPDVAVEGAQASGGLTLGNTGGSQSHPNMQPFIALNYIIALVGVFPTRA